MPTRVFQLLWFTASLAAALLLLLNAALGNLNHDEGWYLHAGRLLATEGLMPYRDFAFTQGPLMVAVYALANPLVEALGLAGGRLVSACLGLLSFVLASRLAGQLTIDPLRRRARLLAFILVGVNVYHSYFNAIPKTYSLAACLLLGGWVLWCAAIRSGRGFGLAVLAGAVMASAAGVRFSSGISLVPAGLFLLRHHRTLGFRRVMGFAVGGLASLFAIYFVFLYACPAQLKFGLLDYHTLRQPGGGLGWLLPKAGFLSRFAQAYFLLFALGLVALLVSWFSGRGPAMPDGLEKSRRHAVGAAALLVSLVHLSAPFPYDDYQVVIAPLLAVLVAVALAETVIGAPPAAGCGGTGIRMIRGNQLSAAVLLVSIVSSFASPLNQDWMIIGRDRVWWRAKPQPDLATLREAAAKVRALAGTDPQPLLTQDLYLAVEAGLSVPRGLEMGPFSWYPDWPRDRCEKFNLVNTVMLEELLRAPNLPVAALSDWSLSIACPGVLPAPPEERARLLGLLRERLTERGRVPDFGQGHSTLVLYGETPP